MVLLSLWRITGVEEEKVPRKNEVEELGVAA